ncbi:MAG: DUF4058 family protein [Isosphaeraceae bacterium]
MPSPFPGMDPYLEKPGLWRDVHLNLIASTQGFLNGELRPKYLVRVEERTYVADESEAALALQARYPDVEVLGRPGWEKSRFSPRGETAQLEVAEPVIATTWFEEEVHEAFLKIIDRESRDVVTVIEILSPTNKIPGSAGRRSFEDKRREVMYSPCHWVEIDLLRGSRLAPVPRKLGPHEYLVHVSTTNLRPRGKLFPIRLAQRLPIIPIPLKPEDPDARLDLQAVLDSAYDRAGYDLEIDYRTEPQPPLEGPLAEWADELLRTKGLR